MGHFRSILPVLIFFLLSPSLSAVCQSPQAAIDYAESITPNPYVMEAKIAEFTRAMLGSDDEAAVSRAQQNIKTYFSGLLSTTRSVGSFQGDDSYRQSMINYFEEALTIFGEEWTDAVSLRAKAGNSYDDMMAFHLAQDRASTAFEEAAERAELARTRFLEANEVQVSEPEPTEQMLRMKRNTEVVRYHSELNLIFQKVAMREIDLVNAQQADDIDGLHALLTLFSSTLQSEKAALNQLGNFEGDASLYNACSEALAFQEELSRDYYPAVIEGSTIIASSRMTIEELDAKAELSNEEISRYNQAVEQYNSHVQRINSLLDRYNPEKAEVFKAWNEAARSFVMKHYR